MPLIDNKIEVEANQNIQWYSRKNNVYIYIIVLKNIEPLKFYVWDRERTVCTSTTCS